MTDAKQPAQFDWATELSDVQGRVTLSEQEAHEIGARLRSLGAKLKAYEDLGDAADDMATAAADGYRSAAAEAAKLKGQRAVLCSLLGECLPVIDALMQMPGDDDSDARLNGLAGRIMDALEVIAEAQVMGGES